jgi:hypothetical protein
MVDQVVTIFKFIIKIRIIYLLIRLKTSAVGYSITTYLSDRENYLFESTNSNL